MTEIKKGRRLVAVLIVAYLAMELYVFLTTTLNRGIVELITQLIRGYLLLVLCAFLYSGRNWARWVLAILSTLGGLFGLHSGVLRALNGQSGISLVVMGLINVASVAILFFVPSVRAFFGQRDTAAQSETVSDAGEAGP